jgi:Tol biopolymer transport system component
MLNRSYVFALFAIVMFCLSVTAHAADEPKDAKASDPLAPWLHGVTFHAVSEQPNRHSIHAYYVTSPESPDGKWVLFYTSTDPTGQENGEIHIRERSTGIERVLARNITTEDAHRVACQQWISNGRRIAYHDYRDGHWVVAVVDVSTGKETIVARDHQLGFGSPTGDLLPIYGYHWKTTEHRDIELVNVETGKTTTAVTAAAAIAKYPDFFSKSFGERPVTLFFPVLSPDDKRLFFKLATAGNGDFRSKGASDRLGLIAYDLDQSRFLLLRENWGHPFWSSDNHTVVEPGGIIVDTNDDSSHKIPGHLPSFHGDHPSFSPDRQLIVTDTTMDAVGGKKTDWGIVLIRISDGHYEMIHTADNSQGAKSWRVSHPHPSFSPDGKRIYFNVSSTGWTQLWVAQSGKE